MTKKTYSTRANAARAARAALAAKHPKGALSGVHFKISDNDDGYGWEEINDGGPALVRARKTAPRPNTPEFEKQVLEDAQAMSARTKQAAKDAIAATRDKTPTPAVTGAGPRWRKPKRSNPSKTAYRPRAGSLQELMYKLLTQEGEQGFGVTVEEFCATMENAGAKPTMTKHEQTWSNLGYLFVSLRGYGLEFDGSRIWLIVPKDERDAQPPKKGG